MHSTQVPLAIIHLANWGLLVKLCMNFSYLWCVLHDYLLYSLCLNAVSTIKWTTLIMYVQHCVLGSTSFLNTLFWNSLSIFHYSERPYFTPIKWYNCLKYNVYNKFIYHIFSSWRGPLRCRLFAGDSVDTWGNVQFRSCKGMSLQCGETVVALYSWQMPVSGWKTKNIYNSGKWILFCDFNYVAQS